MILTTEEKENIKTYFLIKEGIEITEITEFHNFLLLKPYGVIYFEDKIYTNKQIKQDLYLYRRNITDISPLSNLTNLKELSLSYNKITDISPLSNLSNLDYLDLGQNKITDISPLSNLSNLSNLTNLYLSNNKISDISPLFTLFNLTYLNIQNNNIPKDQIKELKLKLPYCSIHT